MEKHMHHKEWLPLLGLTFSAFIFNTSEFMPIGLLTDIAASFQRSEASAGLLISVYALVVMLMSLPLMLLASRADFRGLLLGTLLVFALCQTLSATAQSFGMLMLSRIGVACTHAIFWSIASPLAVRVVSEEFHSLALSLIATGTSVAMIAGMPLGRLIGLYLGWRMTFACVAAAGFLAFGFLFFVFPRLSNPGGFSLRELPELLKNRTLLSLYVFTLLLVSSYYICYSYIEPFLAQAAGFGEALVTETLTLYGACGLFGSFLYARCFEKKPIAFIRIIALAMTAALFLLDPAARHGLLVLPLCAFWGIAVTAFNVTMQGETIHVAPGKAAPVATAIYSGIYNLGISAGSWIGGLVAANGAIHMIGYAGGLLGVLAVLFCFLVFTRLLKALF